jgi:hypothetical protein
MKPPPANPGFGDIRQSNGGELLQSIAVPDDWMIFVHFAA